MENYEQIIENGETKPSRVKVMELPTKQKVFEDLGHEMVFTHSYIGTVEDNLGQMYFKSTGRCRFQLFNDISTDCKARIEFEDFDDNENGWKNVISIYNFPHTHPSPISNPGGVKDWQKAKERNLEESKSPSSTSSSLKRKNKNSDIGKSLETNPGINDESLAQANSGSKSTPFVKVNESAEKSTREMNLRENRPYEVRIMQNEERDACLKKFGIKNGRNSKIVIDKQGHIYGPWGPRFRCKFAKWDNLGQNCYSSFCVVDGLKYWNGWTKVKNTTIIHNHESQYKASREIQGSQSEKLGRGQLNQLDRESTSASEYSIDIDAIAKKRRKVDAEKSQKQMQTTENQLFQARVMQLKERDLCYEIFDSENTDRRGTIVIDNKGHIYGSNGPTFKCKFRDWKFYDRRCHAKISVNSGMKRWNWWTRVKLHSSMGHNHLPPIIDPKHIQGSQSEALGRATPNHCDEESKSASENSVHIDGTSESSTEERSVDIAPQNLHISPQNLHIIPQNLHTAPQKEKVVLPVENISRECEDSILNLLSVGVGNEALKSNEKHEPESSVTQQSNASNSKTLTYDLSLVRSLNQTSQPQLPASLTGLPNSNTPLTSQTTTQSTSTHGSQRHFLLPAWTNCVQCKACVLVDPKSEAKDLICAAETHIKNYHGYEIVNKEIIKQYLPYILNLRKVEQSPVSGSLPVNKGGYFMCAIAKCDVEMLNMRDLTLNDNDLINHCIKQHLAHDERMTSEKLWKCFPVTSPQNQHQDTK